MKNSTGVILAALQFAAHKHRDQRRKDLAASPYINHPIALANVLWGEGRVHDPVVICASLLHDTIEDTRTWNSRPSPSTLCVLRDVGLVRMRCRGRQKLYRTNAEAIRPLHEWAGTFERYWQHQLNRVKERVR